MRYIVFMGTATTVVEARSYQHAIKGVQEKHPVTKHKPYLARDWEARAATEAEIRTFLGSGGKIVKV